MKTAAKCLAALLALSPATALAQQLADVKPAPSPLVLQQQGSFYVGGRTAFTANAGFDKGNSSFADRFSTGDVTIDQMYVQFQKPVDAARHVPVVFIHGCCLSAKTWETTPDGRMGWYEYFTRKGRATYLVEQSGRARSGFDATAFNTARQGTTPASQQPAILLATSQFAWWAFRFGPRYGQAWPDEQFPIDKVGELYKQVIPDLILTEMPNFPKGMTDPASDHPTLTNLAQLASDLGGAILVGHSQSSSFPTQAALKNKGGVRGIVQLETGCFDNLTPAQVALLAKIPMLIMVGDHWATPQPGPACKTEQAQIDAAGGDMTFIALPDLGIHGNSHMFMQDRNNLQVADVILKWIDEHVEHPKTR